MSTKKQHVLVIGLVTEYRSRITNSSDNYDDDSAGVIGLQSALSLLEEGFNVTVVAKHIPGDESIEYTSPWWVMMS